MEHLNQYVLAIDLGTSGPKVALVSTNGQLLHSEIEATNLLLLPNGGAEQDPDDWWQAIVTATRRLLAHSTVAADNIVAVSCTSQWSGTVAVDQTGRHLMNAIIWMDSRGAAYVRQITGGPLKVEGYGLDKIIPWIRLTGGLPTRSGKDSIAHILYIKAKHPHIYAQTYKFLEPKDYLNLRLTGKFAASVDSITLHWVTDNRDINHIRYSDKLLNMAGLERAKLPDLKRSVDVLGGLQPAAADALGLKPDTPVVMGVPDIHSAAIGSGAVADYQAHLYLGTSSWLICHVPFKKTDLFHNMGALPSGIPGRYFVVNEQETAGACLNFLRDNILYHQDELLQETHLPDIYQVFDQMAARTPAGSNGVIFTPWLNGERTPVDDHNVRGGFHNLSLQTTSAHLVRAVLEGVAYNSRWLMMYVEKFIKRPLEGINIIGGGAKSKIWCQIHADVLNRPIHKVQDPIQANTRGAAFLASVALGYLTFEDIPAHIKIAQTFQPNPNNQEIYDKLFAAYTKIYQQNRKIYAGLNR